MRHHLLNLILITLVVFYNSVQAEENKITYEKVLSSALESSPEMAEINTKILEIKAESLKMSQLDNPELFAEVRPYIGSKSNLETEYEIGISQPLKISNFNIRPELARLIEQSSIIEEKFLALEFTENLKLSYEKAWAMQEKESINEEGIRLFKNIKAKIKQGENKGLITSSAVKFLDAQAIKLEADLIGIKAESLKSRALLEKRSSLALGKMTLLPLVNKKLPNISDEDHSLKSDLNHKLKLRHEIARVQNELSHLDNFPQFTPRFLLEHTSDGEDRVVAGFSINLPFFNQNQAEKLKSQGNLAAAEKLNQYNQSTVFSSQIKQLLQNISYLDEQLILYKIKAIPILKDALKLAEEELEAGQGSIYQLSQGLLELISLQDRYLELHVKSLSERVELAILLGREI